MKPQKPFETGKSDGFDRFNPLIEGSNHGQNHGQTDHPSGQRDPADNLGRSRTSIAMPRTPRHAPGLRDSEPHQVPELSHFDAPLTLTGLKSRPGS